MKALSKPRKSTGRNRVSRGCTVFALMIPAALTLANAGGSDGEVARRREPSFPSVEAFVGTIKALKPRTDGTEAGALFVQAAGDADDEPDHPVPAKQIEGRATLHKNTEFALVFAHARTEWDIPSAIGVLFLLRREEVGWRVIDLLRFEANGKYAEVAADQLGSETPSPVMIIRETNGGRHSASTTVVSYVLEKGRLKRLERR